MTHDFFSAVKTRRTVYSLKKAASVPDARIEELLKDALAHVPSPFNSQSGRIVLLLGGRHDEFWNGLKETLRGIVKDPAAFAESAARVDGFKAGYGTVLFFEDQNVVKGLQESFPSYKDHFPFWSHHSSGMLQFAVWTAFAVEGMGASLQHYSPLVDDWLRKRAGAPESWKPIAQMPFGVPSAPAGEKTFTPLEGRFSVLS